MLILGFTCFEYLALKHYGKKSDLVRNLED